MSKLKSSLACIDTPAAKEPQIKALLSVDETIKRLIETRSIHISQSRIISKLVFSNKDNSVRHYRINWVKTFWEKCAFVPTNTIVKSELIRIGITPEGYSYSEINPRR